MRKALIATTLSIVLTTGAIAHEKGHGGHAHGKEETTQLGAHEHGHGKLNIAIEGNKLAMELEIPAYDLVGFEHEPTTDDQKAAVEAARSTLADPTKLFVVDAAAGCSLEKAEVEAEGPIGEAHGGDGGHSHAKSEKGHAHADGEAHSEFHVTYALTCEDTAKITTVTFQFFEAFKNSEELDVSIVGPKGQQTFEASRTNTTLSLGGII